MVVSLEEVEFLMVPVKLVIIFWLKVKYFCFITRNDLLIFIPQLLDLR